MLLESLGWGPDLGLALSQLSSASPLSLVPGRVVRQARGLLSVQTADRLYLARTAGRLLHQASGIEALPTVGDWVALTLPAGEGEALLQAVLPRRSVLVRREAGSEHEGQLIAANFDVVFLVAGLDANFNPRRIERALAVAWKSGATPVVLLSKADLHEEVSARLEEVRTLAPGVSVLPLSAQTGQGLEEVRAWLPPGKTGVLLGSSGVGKSTLVNRLLEEERLATQSVRVEDNKGRHTTTHRELFMLPQGGLLIDGPGVRELGLWGEEEGVQQVFDDVLALAAGCRFSDCRHQREPGCAVRAEVEAGRLSQERLDHFEKLQREQAHRERQVSGAAQREHKRSQRNLTVEASQRSRTKKRGS